MNKITIQYDILKSLIDKKFSIKKISEQLNICRRVILREMNRYNLSSNYDYKLSEETKKKISIKRSEYLQKNPDKHPWKISTKFKSVPCEIVKKYLISQKISFEPEFTPLISIGKNYSIDIAFPEKMIGIEINGNQHYNRDGTLKPYYQLRKQEIENFGWKLYDIHYSLCYRIDDVLIPILKEIIEQPNIRIFIPQPTIKPKKIKPSEADPNWRHREKINCRKVNRPTKEKLEELLKTTSYVQVGKMYGVSDNSIRKWLKYYNRNLVH